MRSFLLIGILLVACDGAMGGDAGPEDGGHALDAGLADAGDDASVDAGRTVDAGRPIDSGIVDAGSDAGSDAGHTDAGRLGCADLATASTADQIAIVIADPTCTDLFVDLLIADPSAHLDAFYALISSSATEALFFSVYAAMSDGSFVFDEAAIVDLYADLAPAIAACTGTRCADWTSFVRGRLDIGELYRCPDLSVLDRAGLLAVLPHGSYACIEALALRLAGLADDALIDALLSEAASAMRAWSRRNALRVLGRFAEGGSALVLTTRASDVTAMLHARLGAESADDPLADVIWILDTFFYPDYGAEAGLEALAENTTRSAAIRFRAVAALTRLYQSKPAVDGGDVMFLARNAASDDPYVRAQIAFFVSTRSAANFPAGGLATVLDAIAAQYAIETVLSPSVYQARALDTHRGGTREAMLRASYEAAHLPNTLTRSTSTIRSGLPMLELTALADRLDDERAAFPILLGGAPFDAPVAGDANPSMTLVVFATRAEYQEYMEAFVGYGRDAGGLYLERAGTLYTYQRTPAESRFTLEELVQHEYGHYLQGRFVYPGFWGDPGDFDQPRGWADEGLAEVLGGLIFDASGAYTMPPRTAHLATLCGMTRALGPLFDLRAGYDQLGVFDYPGAWSYVYFLVRDRPAAAHATYAALRDRTYTRANVHLLGGSPSLSALESAHQAALDGWCAAPPGPLFGRRILRPIERSAHVPRAEAPREGPAPPALASDLLR